MKKHLNQVKIGESREAGGSSREKVEHLFLRCTLLSLFVLAILTAFDCRPFKGNLN